jgi:hypothetical protein
MLRFVNVTTGPLHEDDQWKIQPRKTPRYLTPDAPVIFWNNKENHPLLSPSQRLFDKRYRSGALSERKQRVVVVVVELPLPVNICRRFDFNDSATENS